jgi:hypothetical protein
MDSAQEHRFIVGKWKRGRRFVSASDVNNNLWTASERPPSISLMLRSNAPGPSDQPINQGYLFGG